MTSSTTASNFFAGFQQPLDGRFAVAYDIHRVSFSFQIEPQALGQVRFVLDDKQMAHALLLGNSSTMVVPRAQPALSANTLPPCARAIARTMNRPSPVPFTCEDDAARHPVKALEYALQSVRGDAHAAVANPQHHALLVGRFQLHGNIHAGRPNT